MVGSAEGGGGLIVTTDGKLDVCCGQFVCLLKKFKFLNIGDPERGQGH